jgi:hypothetical protein
MSKTVFVLGAGFSVPAKLPAQIDILKNLSTEIRSKRYYRNVKDLYARLFQIKASQEMGNVPLEDIFTFLDRAISNRESTNTISLDLIPKRQASLRRLISMILNEKMKAFAAQREFEENRVVYERFFRKLIDKRYVNRADDPFCIISLNWDTLPEYFISRIIHSRTKFKDVRIDYTCYDYDYDDDISSPKYIPSIHLKRLRKYNIKLQKLHGSLNWGYCSSCGRLYIKNNYSQPPVFYEDKKEKVCKLCTATPLKRFIITPTLLKDLNNTHLKMIWHNALMDLQEAERIVFIGYSFPLADFEFRYVLAKAMSGSKNADKKKIRVLLYPPENAKDKNDLRSQKRMWQRDIEEERYRNFFGQRVSFEYGDVLDFMKNDRLIWKW